MERRSFWRMKTDLPNPGKFEDISQESNKIFHLDTYEGIMINFQRGLSNSFMIDHAMHLQPSAEQYGTYHFGANFAEGKHLLLSKTATNGEVFARYIGTLTPNFSLNMQAQLVPTPHNSHALITADYKGSDWFAQCKIGSMAQFGFSYLQSITRSLSLGLDFMYLGRPPFNQPPVSIITAGLRYSTERLAFVSKLTSTGQLQASYVQRVRDNLTFGTEMSVDVASTESLCAVGYEYSTQAGSFKTNLTTDGKVTSIFEKTLSEVSSMSLSVEVDHKKQACKYGIGFQLIQ
ncbi:hypothetical protein GUITHDRAFT_166503 [Guillardia theta CCMP2712]|uniref:Uncharacterized protein n=1 Tax=Guillardia theta (strain CCMP2712) TaxID=905079 RepID=L1IB94_GUITC|nr:hypothetical protein GUITHDRAFT_166503 [Guillardia theta CCMP2712]EKX33332.1 hypothetical protein GUITHDRAFT_166503 [Guillardia theta CCMP2712]|eukprot:XP_005820312.1 hypothetical protein GUITHDRAFT_166503 [Guillardia theta CCMP2712]